MMIYQLSTGYFCGSPREMQVEAEEMFKLRNTIAKIYAQKTGQSRNVIQNDLEGDTLMSATKAQDYLSIT
jgi:ATP-dependent Clp protease, protease subunit